MLSYGVFCCRMFSSKRWPRVFCVVFVCLVLPYVVLCCIMLPFALKQVLATFFLSSDVLCCFVLSCVVLCSQSDVGHTCFVLPHVVLCCPMLPYVVLCCHMLHSVLNQLLATHVLFVLGCLIFSVLPYVVTHRFMLSCVARCCLILSYNCWPHALRVVLWCLMLPHVLVCCLMCV